MSERDFAYWLKGFAELSQTAPTAQQWKIIQDHLNLVFNKVTPNYAPVIGTIKSGDAALSNFYRVGAPTATC